MRDKPNFVYIMTDQQRADWLGCCGHPVVRTPNIDALAANGVRFTDFHAASPICMPNRASFMTGRYPSAHGLRYNGCSLSTRAKTFVDVLSAAGYDTASLGKSHLQPFLEVPPKHGPDLKDGKDRLIEEAWVPESHDYPEARSNFEDDTEYEVRLPYFGFDKVSFASGHGDKCWGHYGQWLRKTLPDWKALFDPDNELPHNYSCPQAYRTPIPEDCYPTHWVGSEAVDYLSEAARKDTPFFAFVSFPDPHHPFNPPGKYWDMYDPEDFDVSLPYEAHENPPPPLRSIQESYERKDKQITLQTSFRADERALKEAMALTAGMITMIDDQVGRIVETLKANGLYENTVICFNSDHGDYMGDFGLLLKGMLPFRSITNVPMIWSDPANRKGQVTETMASTVDIGPTILDRAGLVPFYGTQGKSFLPTIEEGESHRDAVFIEYNDGMPKFTFETAARVRTIRSKDWRFSIYADEDWGELYDLQTDPNETKNLWASSKHQTVRGELALALSHMLTRVMDESPRSVRMA